MHTQQKHIQHSTKSGGALRRAATLLRRLQPCGECDKVVKKSLKQPV
ncbi:MAG TPA: hypothetical protein IAC67_04795 [Candidatus Coproplasma excrementipullorum]|nr:hypothetical protein [Candidatus Coproplasma excrementipullorum]